MNKKNIKKSFGNGYTARRPTCSVCHTQGSPFKDASSISWYPHNQSQMLLYIKYTKWINIAKQIAIFYVNNVFWTKKFLPELGFEPWTSRITVWTSRQTECVALSQAI